MAEKVGKENERKAQLMSRNRLSKWLKTEEALLTGFVFCVLVLLVLFVNWLLQFLDKVF